MTEVPWQRSAARLGPFIAQILHALPDTQKGHNMDNVTFLLAGEIPADTKFIKGSRSGAAGHCVELAAVDAGVALRHSKDTARGAFVFTREEMGAFVEGAKNGEFDHLIG